MNRTGVNTRLGASVRPSPQESRHRPRSAGVALVIGFGIVAGFPGALQAADPPMENRPETTPLFGRHVVPMLSRLGCNAGGSCHGTVKGQNGFRLSLSGNARTPNTLAYPTMGSVVAKVKGGPADVPTYVALNMFPSKGAGGGFARGRVVGATDADGMKQTEDECFPEDLAATIYSQLGIDPHAQLMANGERPVRIVDKDDVKIIRKVLA